MKRNIPKIPKGDYGWAFAIVNGKLAEIHFSFNNRKKIKDIRVWGHCYVKREEFKTKKEQKMIDYDIKKNRLTWRNQKYTPVNGAEIAKLMKLK